MLNPGELPFKGAVLAAFTECLEASAYAYEAKDIGYFTENFPKSEHWRILLAYYQEATYFDIETTGIVGVDHHATVITAYRNNRMYTYVIGENLDDFLDLVDDSTLLVAFNGNAFDIPFLERTFSIPSLDCPHVDLRWVCYHAGYTGGLKMIEKKLGIKRPSEVTDVTGNEAILLYYDWQQGDQAAKEKLIKYCSIDTLSTYLVTEYILRTYGLTREPSDQRALFEKINP